MTRIVVVSDEPIFGAGVEAVLSGAGFAMAGTCASFEEFRHALATGAADLALIQLPSGLDFDGLRRLRTEFPDCRMVLAVRGECPDLILHALELGVHGVVSRLLTPERLVEAVRTIAGGGVRFDISLGALPTPLARLHLTPRERQLINLVCQGLQNKEIAQGLGLTPGSVKVYLSRLFDKTGAKDRFELALFGLRNSASLDSPVPRRAESRRAVQPSPAFSTGAAFDLPVAFRA